MLIDQIDMLTRCSDSAAAVAAASLLFVVHFVALNMVGQPQNEDDDSD